MLQGLMTCAMLGLSYGVLYLIYGKKGIALRKLNGKKNLGLVVLISFILLMWAFTIPGFIEDNPLLFTLSTLCCLIIFVPWALIVRKKNRDVVVDYDALTPENASSDSTVLPVNRGTIENIYICPQCGATYGNYNTQGKICSQCSIETLFSGYSSEDWYKLSCETRTNISKSIVSAK